MPKWQAFEKKFPRLSKWVYQIAFFFRSAWALLFFSIWYLPLCRECWGIGLAGTEFMWPQVPVKIFGVEFTWSLLGYNVLRDASGAVLIGGGLED